MRFPIEKFLNPKNGDLEMKPEKPTKQTLKKSYMGPTFVKPENRSKNTTKF